MNMQGQISKIYTAHWHHKLLLGEIKGELNKQRCAMLGARRLNIVKVLILPTLISRFNVFPIKIPDFLRNWQADFKTYMAMWMSVKAKIQNNTHTTYDNKEQGWKS